jgi:hypothetical protein
MTMIKRRFVIGATGLAALGGGGAAYAINQSSSNDRQAFINDVAQRLNVPPDKVKSALQGAFFDRLDAAVTAGKITRAQADAIKQRVQQNGSVPFPGGRPHPFFGGPGGPFVAGFDAAASYLGLTVQQVHDQLDSGKSLADIASDRKKDLAGLKQAIEKGARDRLDTAVKNNRITKAEESQALGKLSSRIDTLVQQKGGRPRFGGRERFRGGPFRGGPPVGGPPPAGPPPY